MYYIFGEPVDDLFYFYPKSLLMLIHYTLPLPVCVSLSHLCHHDEEKGEVMRHREERGAGGCYHYENQGKAQTRSP